MNQVFLPLTVVSEYSILVAVYYVNIAVIHRFKQHVQY